MKSIVRRFTLRLSTTLVTNATVFGGLAKAEETSEPAQVDESHVEQSSLDGPGEADRPGQLAADPAGEVDGPGKREGDPPAKAPASVDSDGIAQSVRNEWAGEEVEAQEMDPPLPSKEAFDWVRFDSGEWVGGDLKEMRDKRISFDSDKMDLLTEDWDDVTEFRSARRYTYVTTELEHFEGPALIQGDTVLIRTDSEIRSFPRKSLLSIVANSDREIDRWSMKLSLAATGRAGNTESIDLNNYLLVRRQDRLTRGTIESTTNLGNVNGQRTVQNWIGTIKGDLFFHRYFYLTPVFASGQHNYFQNLSFRGALGAGAGAHAIDMSWLTVDFDLLGGYQYTENLSVPAATEKAFDDALVGLGTSIEWDITGDLDLDVQWRSYLVVTEMGRTYHNGIARFSMEITDIFDFDLSAALTRIEEPAADEDGNVPGSNDWTFTAGIGLELN